MCIKRVNSFDELSNLYSNLKGLLDIKKGKHVEEGKYNISICGGTGCQASRSEEIKSELERFAKLYDVEEPFGKKENNSSSGVNESTKTGMPVKPDYNF